MDVTTAIVELLLPALLTTGPTRAPAHPVARTEATPTLEVELVERIGKARTRTRLSLPDEGELAAWVSEGDERRFCEVSSHAPGDGVVSITLQCRRGRSGPDDITIKARPRLRPGKPTRIASIERPDGRQLDVEVTLR
ncbi:MAG: hypothetical protein U0168_30980 [Nannocystaceae bacterium]|jgi:hypothetical protein